MDLDQLIHDLIHERKQLSIKDLEELCEKLKEIFTKESNIQPIPAPVTICSNIHGQFSDLLELFRISGDITVTNYVFLGGYVSNGLDSVQVIELLLCLKLKHPEKITLIRGKHETRQISQVYGFQQEVEAKYGSIEPWKMLMELFDYLPIGALINEKIFCVSSGLSPELDTLDQIRLIDRKQEIPFEGGVCDLAWSDPDAGTQGWGISPRGAGFLFGQDVLEKFNYVNRLELIARGHSLVMSGYDYPFEKDNLVTIWSGPNYKGRLGNLGAVVSISENLDRKVMCFKEMP